MKDKTYYLAENGKQIGPFSLEELKAKKVDGESLIWFDGLEKWKKIKDISELSFLLIKTPPPITESEEEKSETNIPPIPEENKIINEANQAKPEYEIATIGERLGGFLIIQILIIIINVIVTGEAIGEDDGFNGSFFTMALLQGLGTGIVNGIFYPFFSGNLGHKLMGIKVIRKSDGTPVNNLIEGFMREFFKGFSSLVLIPIIWLFFNKERQNYYDNVLGTLVIKNKKI